uniref:LysM, putative peptidoglycan-binding, domain containing 2 n=1 Tax=Callorhinchus milii TaxID=7868 RepID=A0A4W3JUC3_CALMI
MRRLPESVCLLFFPGMGFNRIEKKTRLQKPAERLILLISWPPAEPMEQIKRANKLFTSDCIFLKKTLSIPVISEKVLPFNGLNSLDSPENEDSTERGGLGDERPAAVQEESSSSSSPEDPDVRPAQPEELSAKDFLQRLDLQIKRSTEAAAKKLQEDDAGAGDAEQQESLYASSSYHNQS